MSLQYIRAVGAILVVLWHTGWTRSVLGQCGVDLFFVVSGFVMMLVSGREQSPLRFGLARLARIVPLYWVVTLVVAALDRPPPADIVASLLFWPARLFPVLAQGWSLNLEVAYYALFAIALLAPRHRRLLVLAGELALLCALPSLFPTFEPIYLVGNPLAFEFLSGAALYTAWQRHAVPTGARAWLVLGAGTACLAATHFLGDAPAGWVRVIAWGMPALAVVMGSLGVERSGQLPRSALLGTLGEVSYSIYLTHVVAIGLIAGPLRHLWAPTAVAILVPWTCAVGWAVYRVVERPLDRLSKRLIGAVWPKRPLPA